MSNRGDDPRPESVVVVPKTRTSVKVPVGLSNMLDEIGRHVEDRNNLDPFSAPRTLALGVLAERYARDHHEDFEKDEDAMALYVYRGDTDREPLPYDAVEFVELPDPDEEPEDGDETEDADEGDKEQSPSETQDEDPVARSDSDDEDGDSDEDSENMSWTLDLNKDALFRVSDGDGTVLYRKTSNDAGFLPVATEGMYLDSVPLGSFNPDTGFLPAVTPLTPRSQTPGSSSNPVAGSITAVTTTSPRPRPSCGRFNPSMGSITAVTLMVQFSSAAAMKFQSRWGLYYCCDMSAIGVRSTSTTKFQSHGGSITVVTARDIHAEQQHDGVSIPLGALLLL